MTLHELILIGMKGNFAGGMSPEYTSKQIADQVRKRLLDSLPEEMDKPDYKEPNMQEPEYVDGYNTCLKDIKDKLLRGGSHRGS